MWWQAWGSGPLCQSLLRWHGSVLVYTNYRPRLDLSTVSQYLCHSQCQDLPLGHCVELPTRNTSSMQCTTINYKDTQGLSGVHARAPCWIQSDLYCTLISPIMTAEFRGRDAFTQLTCLQLNTQYSKCCIAQPRSNSSWSGLIPYMEARIRRLFAAGLWVVSVVHEGVWNSPLVNINHNVHWHEESAAVLVRGQVFNANDYLLYM